MPKLLPTLSNYTNVGLREISYHKVLWFAQHTKPLKNTNINQPCLFLPSTLYCNKNIFYSSYLCSLIDNAQQTSSPFLIRSQQANYSTDSTPSHQPEKEEESIDDLKSLLKDKSLGLTQKFKIIFQQYGVVALGVHLVNTACWLGIIYTALSQ